LSISKVFNQLNNLIFISHCLLIGLLNLGAIRLGRSAMITTIAVYGILANLFVLKQVTLFGLYVTSADPFIIGISLGMNLLQENFGKDSAKTALWSSFWCLIVYTVLSQIQLWYLPNSFDTSHENFQSLLSLSPRLTVAALCSYFVSQNWELFFYNYLKTKLPSWFALRNWLSIASSQLVDTVLFSLIGLAGLGYNLWHIIIFSYLIKLGAILITTSLVTLFKTYFKPCPIFDLN
jgi:uncharacterized integral membrane protein (TIGR00697 family)